MNLQTFPIRAIERATYNPRVALQPGDPEYESIKHSLQTFGMVEPFVYNLRTQRLVGGHQRLSILEAEHGADYEVDVSTVDLDEAQERILNLALNNAKGRWDEDALARMVRELNEYDHFPATGFDLESVNRILRQHDIRHSTDFLDDIMDSPARAEEPGQVTTTEVTGREGAQFFNMSFALLAEQRELVSRALTFVKQRDQLGTQVDALLQLCRNALPAQAPEPAPRRRRRT